MLKQWIVSVNISMVLTNSKYPRLHDLPVENSLFLIYLILILDLFINDSSNTELYASLHVKSTHNNTDLIPFKYLYSSVSELIADKRKSSFEVNF